jgi:transposase
MTKVARGVPQLNSVKEDLPLSARECTCECGAVHDREINASKNLCCYAVDRASCSRINACEEEGAGAALTTA